MARTTKKIEVEKIVAKYSQEEIENLVSARIHLCSNRIEICRR